ncbi:HAD family hydrolase [Bacillus pseudomycoides]|uniref:HAD family hydrolase n=1 Tax=Bacillus pseudomycoides TaxID=64104 RepID=UPI000BF7A215|nr:HAD hydrolase family protein [Bacillus pseudomycoides]PGD73708.1 hypothetical protein COM46_21760 [Bacillus pseudomycoides]
MFIPNITRRVVAFQDEENDIEMLAYTGNSVAMKNAKEEVINISDYITSSNNKNGVTKSLNVFIL